MTKEEIKLKLQDIIQKNMQIAGVSLEDFDLEDAIAAIGINSIGFVRIVVAIETEFDFEFDDDYLDPTRLQSINDIIEYIMANVNKD
jgi:acyl carrier protein